MGSVRNLETAQVETVVTRGLPVAVFATITPVTQCTRKGKARYVNVQGSVHWKGVYTVSLSH